MSESMIRAVEMSDFESWLSLWESYNKFYGRFGATALPFEITEATWDRFFDANEPVYARVAVQNGKLVGLVHFLFHRSTTALKPVCYLQDLFTSEECRGNGIGKALIEAVYAEAKLADLSRVYWHTHESNVTAMKLYDKVADRTGFLVYRKQF